MRDLYPRMWTNAFWICSRRFHVSFQRLNHAQTGGYKKGIPQSFLSLQKDFLFLSCTVDKEQKKNLQRELVVGKYNKNIPRTGFILQSPPTSYQPLDQTVYISAPGQRAMLLICDSGGAEKEADIFWVQYRRVVPDVKTLLRHVNYTLPWQFTLEWLITTTTSRGL